jgi:putative methionine-R-sulfoxide reductase with GAF domain
MGNLARTLYTESSATGSARTPAPARELQALAQNLVESLDANGIAIAHQDGENPEALVCLVSVGDGAPLVGARLDRDSGISGRCVRECRVQRSYDTSIDPRVERAACERLGIRSLVVVPLVADSGCIGLIAAFSGRPGHFDADKVLALERAAESATLLLDEQQNVTEQPVAFVSKSSHAPFEEKSPARQISENSDPPDQEVAMASPEHVGISVRESIPRFLETQQSQAGSSRLRWAVIGVVALVAAVAGTRDLHRNSRPHLLAIQPRAANSTVARTAQAAQTSSSAEISKITSTASPVAGAEQSSPLHLLAERAKDRDVAAQMSLARAYMIGDHVPKDPAKAASWYVMAGENGSAAAKRRSIEITRGMAPFQIAEIRFNLGKMYMNGIGTKQDYVSAYKWLELSKVAGDIRAEAEESKLQKKMNSDQVQEARKQASDWLQSHSRKLSVSNFAR